MDTARAIERDRSNGSHKNWVQQGLAVLALAATLAGCGGGSGSDGSAPLGAFKLDATDARPTQEATTQDPTLATAVNQRINLSLAPQSIKLFHFTWANVPGVKEYRLLENADGISGYTQVTSTPAGITSYDHEVFLPGRINASYIVQACHSLHADVGSGAGHQRAGCVDSDPVYVSGSLVPAVGYVKASNAEQFDAFGFRVALAADGRTMAVAALREQSSATGVDGSQTDNSADYAGAVYVFVRNGPGLWSQQAYLKASNTDVSDLFGWDVSLAGDGNTVAVSAMGERSSATGVDGNQADNSAPESGAVYVFSRSEGNWSQQAYIKASNTGTGDYFGSRISLAADGNTLAVGARAESSSATGINGNQGDDSAHASGAVYVFARIGATWSQQAYVKASNAQADDLFGASVALAADGNTLAVGAHGEASAATGIDGNQADNSAEDSGAAYVFTRTGTNWAQQAYLKASNAQIYDAFGYSIALAADGDTIAVGAIGEASGATGVNGNQADNSASYSGAAYVFSRTAGAWAQQAYIKASNTNYADSFGYSIELSANGNVLAVGARNESSSAAGINGNQADNSAGVSGAVYLFSRQDATWSQQSYVKASNPRLGTAFGASIALAGDGGTLAVGSEGEASNATGIGGNQADQSAPTSGAVYLY